MSSPLLKNLNFKWLAKSRSSVDYRNVPLDDEKSDYRDSDSISSTEKGAVRRSLRLPSRASTFWNRLRARIPGPLHIIIALLSISLAIVTTLHIRLIIKTTPHPIEDCGNTLEEAHAKGCIFDQLVKTWLPPSCPSYGLTEYLAAGHAQADANVTGWDGPGMGRQWRYWHDRERSREISLLELADMAAPIAEGDRWWTTNREHANHCAWMLVRMAWVFTNNQRRDILVSNFAHAKHCTLFLLNRAEASPFVDEIRSVGNVNFGFC